MIELTKHIIVPHDDLKMHCLQFVQTIHQVSNISTKRYVRVSTFNDTQGKTCRDGKSEN